MELTKAIDQSELSLQMTGNEKAGTWQCAHTEQAKPSKVHIHNRFNSNT